MNDNLFDLCRSRKRPRDETVLLTPNPDSARWVVEQWQKRVDGELLAGGGVGGSAAATEPKLTLSVLNQIVSGLLAPALEQEEAIQRLVERLRATSLIRYIASPSIPTTDQKGGAIWYWEQCDVFLIAPDWVPRVRQQFEQVGYTLVEVDEAWWLLQTSALMNKLGPAWESRL